MPATYRCTACDAQWKADHEPNDCPRCGGRIIDRADGKPSKFDDFFAPPQAPLPVAAVPPVSSLAFSINYWGGVAVIIGGYAYLLILSDRNKPNPIAIVTIFIGMVTLLAAFILGLIKIYKAWDLIQPLKQLDPVEREMPSPGLAVGLLLIPLFNLYWNFVALYGLAKRANKYLLLSGIKGQPMTLGVAQTLCILTPCSIIPCVGSIIAIFNTVLYYLFILDVDRFRSSIQPEELDFLPDL
jgi:hypothetical protein